LILLAAFEEPTRLSVAAPFIAGAVLLFLGPFVAMAVEARLATVFQNWLDDDGLPPRALAKLGSYSPETVAKSSVWSIDAAQILATFLLPWLGVALLRPGLALFLLYLVVSVVVLAGLLWFIYRVKADDYHTRGVWIFTPVPLFGIPVNVAAAIVAAAIGP
jgi:hypothetical protein